MDGEKGIVNAVQQLVDVHCWDHVFNDIKAFVTKNGGKKEEAKVYRDDIKIILQGKTAEENVSQKWSAICIEYYNKHLRLLLPKKAHWAVSDIILMDDDSRITQNQSESINFVMHSMLKWKEVPVDALLLAIYHLQSNAAEQG